MLIEIESDFQLFSPFQQANILVNGLRVFAAEINWNSLEMGLCGSRSELRLQVSSDPSPDCLFTD